MNQPTTVFLFQLHLDTASTEQPYASSNWLIDQSSFPGPTRPLHVHLPDPSPPCFSPPQSLHFPILSPFLSPQSTLSIWQLKGLTNDSLQNLQSIPVPHGTPSLLTLLKFPSSRCSIQGREKCLVAHS